MSARRSTTRPAFPGLEADHGEDPARFLAGSEQLALARIRGIDDVTLVNVWAAVERRAFGARPTILDALADRRSVLEEGNRV